MSDELDPLGPLGLPDPLDPLAEDLFRAERDHLAPVDPARAARLYAKVAETVAFTAPSIDAPHPPAPPASPADPGTPVAPALTAKALAPWVLSAFFGGVVAGALARGALQTPSGVVPPPSASTTLVVPVPSVSTSAPSVSPSPSVVAPPSATISAAPSTSKPAVPQAPPSADTDPQSLDKSLTAERALVERARVALSRHQGSMALDALAEHEATFPRGRLIEEREALRIRALVDAGRVSEAEAKARAFRARWPNSVFLSAVDLAVAPR